MSGIRASRLRTLSVLLFPALAAAGLAFHTGTGTLSSFGYRSIAAVCPLGSIEAMLAGRMFLPAAMISLAVLAAIALLLGKIFCAWICPVPTLRSWIFWRRENGGNGAQASEPAAPGAEGPTSELHPEGGLPKLSLDSRHFVLGGALLSTAIFGFPVFCLICPIGLIFATMIGLWRLFQFNEPSWSLLLFPAILAVELVICRRWCRKICPLGALFSLLSGLNVFLRPKVHRGACVRISKGMDCTLCQSACPEEIDLHHAGSSQPLSECTRCRACSDSCPSGAITFPFLPGRKP